MNLYYILGNRDEMSNPTIPQSEYEELLKELFGDLPDLHVFDYEEGSEKTITEQQSEAQSYDKQKSITTPKAPVSSDTFQPTQMSTPLSEIRNKPNTFSPTSGASILPGVPKLCYNQSTNPYTIPLKQLNPYQSAILRDGIVQLPQFQQFIITVPTIDILKSQNIHIDHSQTETNQNSIVSPTINDSEKPQRRRNFDFLKNERPTIYVRVDFITC